MQKIYGRTRIPKCDFNKVHDFTTKKQPFTGVLQKSCSEKFLKNPRKVPLLESLFRQVVGQEPATL